MAAPVSRDRRHPLFRRVGVFLVPNRLPEPVDPALVKEAEKRAQSVQNRGADRITAFSGSMQLTLTKELHGGARKQS